MHRIDLDPVVHQWNPADATQGYSIVDCRRLPRKLPEENADHHPRDNPMGKEVHFSRTATKIKQGRHV